MYGKNNWLITLCPVKGRVWHPDCCSLLFCNVGTMVLPMETLASSRVTTGFLGIGEGRRSPGIDQLCPSWLVLREDLFGFLTVESSPKNECCWEEAESTWWSAARTTLPTGLLIYRGELKLTLLEDRHSSLSRRTGGEVCMGRHDLVVSHILLEKLRWAEAHLKCFYMSACSMEGHGRNYKSLSSCRAMIFLGAMVEHFSQLECSDRCIESL